MTSPVKNKPAHRCHSADRIRQDLLTPGVDEIPSAEHSIQTDYN